LTATRILARAARNEKLREPSELYDGEMGVPLADLVWLAVAVVMAGVVTGVLAGLFGIGGGAVIVPVLFEVFRVVGVPDEVRMQLCVGTSLAIIVPTTVQSYRAHRARGLVIREVIRYWAVPSVFGVAVGAVAAAFAPGGVFKIAFVVIAGIIAAKLLLGREDWVLAGELPGRLPMNAYGFLVGLASSLMGISGGSVVNLILTLYGKPIHNAVATAAGIGVPITIAGTIGYCLAGLPHQSLLPPLSIGFVSVLGVVLIAPISSYVAPFGARLAHALPRRRLEIGFGLFLLVAATRFVISLVQQ
jgi:uncharacterized membrane protein YfcA